MREARRKSPSERRCRFCESMQHLRCSHGNERALHSRSLLQSSENKLLEKILRRCGVYYHSADLFYHEPWKQHLTHLGFRVLKVERLPSHPVWSIRLVGNLTTQTYLLVSKPYPAKLSLTQDVVCQQLGSEIQRIAKEL